MSFTLAASVFLTTKSATPSPMTMAAATAACCACKTRHKCNIRVMVRDNAIGVAIIAVIQRVAQYKQCRRQRNNQSIQQQYIQLTTKASLP